MLCPLSFAFTAPPDLGKDQMQFPRFQPHLACPGFQFRDGPNRHPGKMLRLTCLLLARPNALQKCFLRDGIIGLNIICPHARSGSNQLADDSVFRRPLRIIISVRAFRFRHFFDIRHSCFVISSYAPRMRETSGSVRSRLRISSRDAFLMWSTLIA